MYALLSLLPPSMETPRLAGPVIAIVGLLLPFLSGEGEELAPEMIAVLTVLLIAVTLGTSFTHLVGSP
jgi:hypothetical protein